MSNMRRLGAFVSRYAAVLVVAGLILFAYDAHVGFWGIVGAVCLGAGLIATHIRIQQLGTLEKPRESSGGKADDAIS
jgi:hypothetical protein